jgi:hypothetical protein
MRRARARSRSGMGILRPCTCGGRGGRSCRAVLFSQLVDDPSSWPERFLTEAAQGSALDACDSRVADCLVWFNLMGLDATKRRVHETE